MSAHLIWKIAHIFGATLLFGTGLGIAFYCGFGYRSAMRFRDIGALRSTLRLTVIADACFTTPAVIFQVISGIALMRELNWPFMSAWSIAVTVLFTLVGVCWLPVVAIQASLAREVARAPAIESLPPAFHRRFRIWFALGVPAFIGVLVIFYLMVAKPLSYMGV